MLWRWEWRPVSSTGGVRCAGLPDRRYGGLPARIVRVSLAARSQGVSLVFSILEPRYP